MCICNIIIIIFLYLYFFFPNLSVVGHLGGFPILAIVNNAVMNRYLFDIVFSFPLAIYPEVELLAHIVVLFLTF